MLKIYGVPISVHTRKTIVTAIYKSLPHEVVPVVPVVPDNPPPNWRDLSPTGKIPALSDGNFTVFDSTAICAYLERLQPEPPIYPRDNQAYALALAYEQYGATLYREVVHPLFFETFVNPNVRGVPKDQRAVDAVLANIVPEIFGHLDGVAGDAFLAGPQFSIADITIASSLITYQYIGFDVDRSRYPRLAAWLERVIVHPAVNTAIERERPVVESMGLRADLRRAA